MKFLILYLFGHFCILSSYSQSIDYNTIILPLSANHASIEEKLVQLAWNNNPANNIEYNKLLIAEKHVGISRAEWLNIFGFSGNINEFTINPNNIADNRYYPRYNLSSRINLGIFVQVPSATKIAKLEVANQMETINLRKLEVRSDILKKYYNYKLYKELVKTHANFADGAYSNFLMAEQQFKNGKISFEEYNRSLNIYDQLLVNKLQKETDLKIAEIEIEALIGMKLVDVLSGY